jgi:hypothetical protein
VEVDYVEYELFQSESVEATDTEEANTQGSPPDVERREARDMEEEMAQNGEAAQAEGFKYGSKHGGRV